MILRPSFKKPKASTAVAVTPSASKSPNIATFSPEVMDTFNLLMASSMSGNFVGA